MSWERALLQLMVSAGPIVIDADDWPAIDHAARAHRLTPLLHGRAQDGIFAAPRELRREWALDYLRAQQRGGAIAATVHDISAMLDGAAIRHAFLKGVHVGWGSYADPVRRTMRDVDVLIDADRLVAARDLLRDAGGYREAPFGVKDDAMALNSAKHLTPLIAPQGDITVELHHMLTDPVAELGCAARLADTESLLATSQRIDLAGTTVPVLREEDMLLHIVYHSAYDHFFCNGPQVIADVAALAGQQAINWDYVWERAAAQAMTAGLAIVLGLVRWHAGADVAIPARWTADDVPMDHAARVMMRDNYADRVARTVSDLGRSATPRALIAAIRGKFANQNVIAANNAHLIDAERAQRSRLSAIGDVARHLLRDERRDAALRSLLRDN